MYQPLAPYLSPPPPSLLSPSLSRDKSSWTRNGDRWINQSLTRLDYSIFSFSFSTWSTNASIATTSAARRGSIQLVFEIALFERIPVRIGVEVAWIFVLVVIGLWAWIVRDTG